MLQTILVKGSFNTENGSVLNDLTIGFHTFGKLNDTRSNVVWICHALTAGSDVTEWWPELVGGGRVIDTEKYFVVCANILGSCYGTTGPESQNIYGHTFPEITIRDMVSAHIILRKHLGIDRIHLLAGGSMGGFQAQEWALTEPDLISNLFLLATVAEESPWARAIHFTQRAAIELDPTWASGQIGCGQEGLKIARGIGMLSYRNSVYFNKYQADNEITRTKQFKSASYLNYQGEKLANRFNAKSYHTLTKAMDTHNLARGRYSSIEEAIIQIKSRVLLLAITSDILCPLSEVKKLSSHIPDCEFHEIESDFGHDGFLIETEKISEILKEFLNENLGAEGF